MGFGNPFKSLEKEIKKGLEKLGNSIKDGLKRVGREIESNLKKVASKLESGIKDVAHQCESGIKSVANKAEDEIKDFAHDAEEAVKSVAEDVKGEIEEVADKAIDELEEEAQEVLNKIFEGITKESLSTALEVAKKAEHITETALTDASFGIDVSIVGFGWNDIGGRMGSIREKIEALIEKKPEISREYILQCIKTLAPDTISFSIDVNLAALVVTSEAVGVGFNFSISTPAFLDAADELLDAIGL